MTRTRTPATKSVLDAALEQIDGLAELDAQIEVADQIPDLEITGNFNAEWEAALERALDAVRSGTRIPDDIAERAVLAKSGPDRMQLTAVIRERTLGTLVNERNTTFARGANRALTYLAGELDTLLTDVLDTVESTQDDSTLNALADRYDEIRRAQQLVTTRVLKERQTRIPPQLLSSTGLFRDSVNQAAYWLNHRAEQAARSNPTSTAADTYVAWLRPTNGATRDPSRTTLPGRIDALANQSSISYQIAQTNPRTEATEKASPWWPDANRIRHLTQAAQADALWLPTIDDLLATHTAAWAMTGAVIGKLYSGHTNARADYYDLIGLDDPEQFSNDDRVINDQPRNDRGQVIAKPRITGTRTR